MCAKRGLVVLLLLAICAGCASVRTLSAQDLRAVRAAEAFVLANGYTSEPPSLPFEQLKPELYDRLISQSEVLAHRHDYLEPSAVGFLRNANGWLVVFKVTDHAVSSRKDTFPFSPVGLYVPVSKQFKVGGCVCHCRACYRRRISEWTTNVSRSERRSHRVEPPARERTQ